MSTTDDATTGHRRALKAVLQQGDVSLETLWLRAFSLGIDIDPLDVEAYLAGLLPLSPLQRDVLAHAANELLDEIAGRLRVPYSRPLRGPLPAQGPLAALVELLDDSRLVLAEHLADVAARAAGALGVELAVYLVDDEQLRLVPLPGGRDTLAPVQLDGTLPGRAFQTGTTQARLTDPQPRMWVPLIDGAERLGVLDVRVSSDRELGDPYLRKHCEWVAALLAHLVVTAAEHGDEIERVRRSRPWSTSGELSSAVLPPRVAHTDVFSVAGMLEPANEIGGDAFDYAVSASSVRLAIFDGMGHSLTAGLIAAAAVAAYRASRRAGRPLIDQALAIDDALAGTFPDAFATGVLCELDMRTGRLRYLIAGHPAPLLLRETKVVGTLGGGRRVPFGIDAHLAPLKVSEGEAALQPGDSLVLYTDGITEARDATGGFFGQERLVDFLEREAAAAQPPAETVRRLVRAVLRHQGRDLDDDATVLLAHWSPPRGAPRADDDVRDGGADLACSTRSGGQRHPVPSTDRYSGGAMSENATGSTPSGQDKEGAAASMRDLPGETALGNVDPATATDPSEIGRNAEEVAAERGFPEGASGGGNSSAASRQAEADASQTASPTGTEDLDRSGSSTPLGDESTGGEAAREALGVDPGSVGADGEIPDNSTGEGTRDQVVGGGGS